MRWDALLSAEAVDLRAPRPTSEYGVRPFDLVGAVPSTVEGRLQPDLDEILAPWSVKMV
jgi:hypothetical protein